MNTELEPGYYYWKLTAYQSSTDSKLLKYVMVPAILGKMQDTSISKIILRKTWAHVASAETTKFFNDRHDARVAAGNQSLFND